MTLYSTNCPKCKVLIAKLKLKGLEYKLVDDVNEVTKFGSEHGANFAPILELDDGRILDFTEAVRYLSGL